MRQTIKKTFLLLVLSGFAISVAAQPQQGRKNMQGQNKQLAQNERGQRGNQEMRLPNLTEDQKEQIKEIRLNGQKEALPIRNALGEKKAKLRTLTTSEDYNERTVNGVIDEIADLEASIMKLKETHRQEVRSILTEEQRIVFDTRGRNSQKRGPNKVKRGKR